MVLPGPSSSQDESNSVAREDSSQAGEVWVAVCWLLEHTLIQLQLKNREITVIKSKEKEWGDGEERKDYEKILNEAKRGTARRGQREVLWSADE